jgi:hypothetical protein
MLLEQCLACPRRVAPGYVCDPRTGSHPSPSLPRLQACGGGSGWGVDNMMWGSDYPHSESTFPGSRRILVKILEGVPGRLR